MMTDKDVSVPLRRHMKKGRERIIRSFLFLSDVVFSKASYRLVML